MIQNMATLVEQANKVNQYLSESAFIQKVQSTPISVVLRIRLPGKSVFLHLGRGRGTEGLWLGESAPIADIRVKDKFQEWIKKYIVGQKIIHVSVDTKYRILIFSLSSKYGESSFGIFYKGRKLYFSYKTLGLENSSFKSWLLGSEENSEKNLFEDIYEGPEDKRGEVLVGDIEETYEKLITFKEDTKRKKLLKKKIETELKKINNIEQAVPLQGQMYSLNSIEINQRFKLLGLSIKEKYGENEHRFRDRAFTKIKNFKTSKKFSEDKILKLNQELENSKETSYLQKTKFPVWAKEVKHKKNKDVVFFSIGKTKGAIGKNVKGNDYLRNKFSSKAEDSWFHLEGEKSSHVVIKAKLEDLTSKEIEQIGSLIRDQMHLSLGNVKLIGSSIKNIKGLKGRPGAVTISNPNYFEVLYNSAWKEIISID
jgi:hypothetical protein